MTGVVSVDSEEVENREWAYYIFNNLCQECPITIQLQSLSGAMPQLYVTASDGSLPTKVKYDVLSTTTDSDILTLDLDQEFFDKI